MISNTIYFKRKNGEQVSAELQRRLQAMDIAQIKQEYVKYARPYMIKLFDENTSKISKEVQQKRQELQAATTTYDEVHQGCEKQTLISDTIALFRESFSWLLSEGALQEKQRELQNMDMEGIKQEYVRYAKYCIIKKFGENTYKISKEVLQQDMRKKLETMTTYDEAIQCYNKQTKIYDMIYDFIGNIVNDTYQIILIRLRGILLVKRYQQNCCSSFKIWI